jgi:preprotein translocase subunit SecF
MRRKLAYLLLSGAILFGAAATMGSTITSLDSDITYGYGKEFHFRLAKSDSTYDGVQASDYLGNENDYEAVDAVATEMENRLKAWDANGTVTKVGYDEIKVSIRAQKADATEYKYLENYLPFSGGNLTITAGCSDTSVQKKADDAYLGDKYSDNAMFEGQTASITYVNNIPVVTIPVNSPGEKEAMGDLINFCTSNTKAANSSTNTEAVNCYLVIWANRQTGDNYADATAEGAAQDVNMAKRLIFGENATNAWYEPKDADNKYKTLQLVPNSDALTSSGYDASKADSAYKAAKYYLNMLNASNYHTILGDKRGVDVVYSYSNDIEASVESLIKAGDWHLSPAFNMTLIACLVCLAFAAILLGLYYRLGAVAILSNVAVSLVSTLLLFVYFHAQFGIGALIGLLLVAMVTGFGGVYYFAKVKEELYAGRSPKKAHQEAIKKALWPTIDSGIISVVIGLCIYGLLPDVMGKMGLVLVFGGALGAISNILILRLEGWLLGNDNTVETQLGRSYGVDESKLIDPLKEEKQTYFGPYADTNFQKGHKVIAVVAALVAIASIAGVATFSALKGTAYNYADAYADTTSLSFEYWSQKGSNASKVTTEANLRSDFLSNVSLTLPGESAATTLNDLAGTIVSENSEVYDSENKITYTVYYYDVPLSKTLDVSATTYQISSTFAGTTASYPTLAEALSEGASNFDSSLVASANVVSVQSGTPTLGSVYVAIGISLASLFVYFWLRYKLARSVSVTLFAGIAGLAVAGFFALTRLAVTPLISIGIVSATLLAYVLSLFILNKEKELTHESRERDKTTLDFKAATLKLANQQGAGDLVLYALIVSVSFIALSGILPSIWRYDSLASLIGFVVALVLILSLLTPFSVYLDKLLSQIHINFHPLKKETPNPSANGPRKRGAEPEEAVFIGIND